MNTKFVENLKKFRTEKELTQEQVAKVLHISAQTVSRWECGTTLPDVLTLPDIARLYSVTVDDFYKESTVAYKNYAQGLASVYENTGKYEDFFAAYVEFNKLIGTNLQSADDLRIFGSILKLFMKHCKSKANSLFNTVISGAIESDEKTLWRTKLEQLNLCCEFGDANQFIKEKLESIGKNKNDLKEWTLLIIAYFQTGNIKEAYDNFLKAKDIVHGDYLFFTLGGDICRALKKYDEAFENWEKAIILEPKFLDAKYSESFCYEEIGEFRKAYAISLQIAEQLKNDGYEVEANAEQQRAKILLEKTK